MYRFKTLTAADGAAKNQEMYEWLTANCADLFDSITIDEGQTRVSCNIGDVEIFGLSSNSTIYKSNIYWKNTAQFTDDNTTGSKRFFHCIYRINNGIFISLTNDINFARPQSMSDVAISLKIPVHGIIKSESDMFFINAGSINNNCDLEYGNGGFLGMYKNTNTWEYAISSKNDGNGSVYSRIVSNFYHNIAETATLVQMRCTNSDETIIPGAYWLKKAPTREVGLITINNKEYFSNGVYCILNE